LLYLPDVESRLEDSGIRELAYDAIESTNALAHASGTQIQEATETTAERLEEAILELGALIGNGPAHKRRARPSVSRSHRYRVVAGHLSDEDRLPG
jgi:hypothetical protein